MTIREYREAVASWALSCLRGEGGARTGAERRQPGLAIGDVTTRFGLDATERALVELCFAVERSLPVAQAARAAAGGQARGLTVEVARMALGDGVDGALAALRSLRGHALVSVGDGSPWGPAWATAELRLGAGLAERLDGAAHVEGLAPGVRLIGPVVDGTEWVEQVPPSARAAELVKEELIGVPAELFTVEGCGRREALGLGVALARRTARGVLSVDGAVLAGSSASPFALLAALRRDADLDGQILLVYHLASLGEAWRAAAGKAPAAPLHPLLVLLTDEGKPPEATFGDGLARRSLVLYAAPAAPGTPATATAATAAAAPTRDDGYEAIRQMAARDADRALGIVRSEPALRRPPPPAPPAPVAAAPAPPAPPAPVVVAAPAPITPPPVATAPAPAQAATALPAEAAAEPAKAKRRSKKGMQHFGDPTANQPAAVAAKAPPAVAAAVAAPFPPPPAAAAAPSPVVDGLPMMLPEKATPDDLARISIQSPSATQRVELINALAGYKSAAVVASLRHNAKSEHPGVRAAAESAMQAMFGAKWNNTRAVPKPVQPPRSEDKGGGW